MSPEDTKDTCSVDPSPSPPCLPQAECVAVEQEVKGREEEILREKEHSTIVFASPSTLFASSASES
jgi:hypothetical protein